MELLKRVFYSEWKPGILDGKTDNYGILIWIFLSELASFYDMQYTFNTLCYVFQTLTKIPIWFDFPPMLGPFGP